MEDIIIIVILTAIVGGIVFYLWKARKRGQKCLGCPHAEKCQQVRCQSCNKDIENDKEL